MSGSRATGSGSGSTGNTTSLSFIPALLSNAFFGTGIGLDKTGGFRMTGTGDFTQGGRLKGPRATSLVDPTGLQSGDPFTNITGSGAGGNPFADFLGGISDTPDGGDGGPLDALLQDFGQGGGEAGGAGGALNPFDLLTNIMDLINPNINPGLAGGLAGIRSGELGQLAGNRALFGEGGLSETFQEGLSTGFKPDLQPVIDEASRAFFSEIVPQLGQQNVAMQEGVGPFSSDLTGQLTNAGGALASQLGALEVQNQNQAADRRGEFMGLSGLITDQLFNAGPNAGRNMMDLGEQFALQGTTGGRQATLLQLLAGMTPQGPIQASSSQNRSKSAGGGI